VKVLPCKYLYNIVIIYFISLKNNLIYESSIIKSTSLDIDLRPNYHLIDSRVEGHIFDIFS